jgi:nitrogen regulatory protein PII
MDELPNERPESDKPAFELIWCIVGHEQGSKALKIAKKEGVRGGTICIGRGVRHTRILDLLDANDSRKEIVVMAAGSEVAQAAVKALVQRMHLYFRHRGVVFSLPLESFVFSKGRDWRRAQTTKKEGRTVHQAIFTVVEKGRAEEVVDASLAAGARGGTILNARGAGPHETGALFGMTIEPEREIVLIVAETARTEAIVEAIRTNLRIDDAGVGIIFTMDVNQAFGLY